MNISIAIALVASLVAATPAFASAPEGETRRVHVADLDLGSTEGRATLDRRIKSAARHVCHDGASISGYAQSAEWQCIQDAIEGTRPQVSLLVAAASREVALSNVTARQ
jgi:UrcA family protein